MPIAATIETPSTSLNISAVERESGLSKDILRVWERRYGFPNPMRDCNSERAYSPSDLAKLKLLKRLIETGLRPSKIARLSLQELNSLCDARLGARPDVSAAGIEGRVLDLLRSHDIAALRNTLANLLMARGLQYFVIESLSPLVRVVVEHTRRAMLMEFEESAFLEQSKAVVHSGLSAVTPSASGPCIVLASAFNERCTLDLLMMEAAMASEGAQCVSLGIQGSLDGISRAAVAYQADIVALTFSPGLSVHKACDGLIALRKQLRQNARLWAGGSTIGLVRRKLSGIALFPELSSLVEMLRAWRPGSEQSR